MTRLLPISSIDTFVSTRESMHRVAEHVLAKARYLDDGDVGLVACTGGFATPVLIGGRRVRVDADDLVVDEADRTRRTPLTTVAAAAAFVDVEPGFPTELYAPATVAHADAPLEVDRRSAAALAAWFGFTAEVLDTFAIELSDARPSPLVLWPEHFDQAFYTDDADESHRANYGASPGDDGHPEPYLYVGPWGAHSDDGFWNATHFGGAVLALSSIIAAPDPMGSALTFLRTGRALITRG